MRLGTRSERLVLSIALAIGSLWIACGGGGGGGGALSWDGRYLWADEFKFSGRLVRLSPSP